jgi:hypothetical protein
MQDLPQPPEAQEPGDARIPALVERLAIGEKAYSELRNIAQEMYDRGELRYGADIYPGVKIYSYPVISGNRRVYLSYNDLGQHLPDKSQPESW